MDMPMEKWLDYGRYLLAAIVALGGIDGSTWSIETFTSSMECRARTLA